MTERSMAGFKNDPFNIDQVIFPLWEAVRKNQFYLVYEMKEKQLCLALNSGSVCGCFGEPCPKTVGKVMFVLTRGKTRSLQQVKVVPSHCSVLRVPSFWLPSIQMGNEMFIQTQDGKLLGS